MTRLIPALSIVLATGSVLEAITWEFTEEEAAATSPWTAWQGYFDRDREIYDSRVEGGSWIIDIPEILAPWENDSSEILEPSLEILSPILGHDSALFDQVRVRIRFVTDRPFQIGPVLGWTNSTHPRHWGEGTLLFLKELVPVDGSWQELTFDLRAARGDFWSGELQDFRLIFLFEPGMRSVEVDRITLTGSEEGLAGELAPPPPVPGAPSGELFGEARFAPLGLRGIGWSGGMPEAPVAVLDDFDGDRILDLASAWRRSGGRNTTFSEYGWTVARGDGSGRFQAPWISEVHERSVALLSGDTDGSGSAEVLWTSALSTQLLRSRPGTWEVAGELEGVVPFLAADADGDGDVDLLAHDMSTGRSFTGLMLNDGRGRFDDRVDLSATEGGLIRGVANACGVGRLGALWVRGRGLDGVDHYAVTCLDGDGRVTELPLHASVPDDWLRFAGDLDGDGDIDLLVQEGTGTAGRLLVLTNAGDGTMIEEVLEERARVTGVQAADLDLDGDSDLLLVDARVRSPALAVYLAGDGGRLALEGRYPLEGRATQVLAGDLNGDGWPDAVVLEPAARQTGGVYTLLNRGLDTPTNVTLDNSDPDQGAGPEVAVYPNPFNSNVVIRLGAGLGGDAVSMSVYNAAGQQVRRLVRGTIPSGTHEVTWDGSTDAGEPVSSGVYFLRVESGRRSLVSKMLVAR